MDTLQVIRQFLNEQYGIATDRIIPEATLAELGIDSLIFVELVFEFESHLGINVPMEELTRPDTIAELVSLVDGLTTGHH